MITSYMNQSFDKKLKINSKYLKSFTKLQFDSVDTRLNKAINAETKQAISTLYEVGSKNKNR